MEEAIKNRPRTRAWTTLLASAERDALKAEQLRREADRYIRESNALARRRIARRKAVASQLTPRGSAWDPDWTCESELKRFAQGESLEKVIDDVARFGGEVRSMKRMLESGVGEWKVKMAAFERFEVLVERVEGGLEGREEVLEEVVELMAGEVVGLRGTLVKTAAEAVAKGARLFSKEQIVRLVDAALTARTKTKKVMADAADALARALLREGKDRSVWEFVADKVETSPHPVQRKSCCDYVCDIGIESDIEDFEGIVKKVVEVAMLDKSAIVREAAKALFKGYKEQNASKAQEMVQSFSQEVQTRLRSSTQSKGTAAGGKKAKGLSMKEKIRERRRQMQAAKANDTKSLGDQAKSQNGFDDMAQDKENQTSGANVIKSPQAIA